MNVVAAILALLAVILLLLLVITRRNAKTAASRAALSRSSLESELTTAQRARARAQSEAEAAAKKADEAAIQAKSELDAAMAAASAAAERASAAEALAAQRGEKVDSLERLSVELTSDAAKAAEEAQAAHDAAVAATAELEAARASSSEGSAFAGHGVDPELLWALEITRSERTWRHSVAVDPNAPSPFPDAPDPLRFAVEVEAAAMREEVGAFIHLTWEAEAVADPVRRLLVLRVANELLAAAAREPQPFEMIATGSDEVMLRVRSTEEGDRQIHIDPPRFGTDVISFNSDDEGISVTIR